MAQFIKLSEISEGGESQTVWVNKEKVIRVQAEGEKKCRLELEGSRDRVDGRQTWILVEGTPTELLAKLTQ